MEYGKANVSSVMPKPLKLYMILIHLFSYYRAFAKIYGYCGNFADIVMVNSTWTKGHIESLWNRDADIVYPPCDTERFSELPIENRERYIASLAQFR